VTGKFACSLPAASILSVNHKALISEKMLKKRLL